MSFKFTVSPDFKPGLISGWFILNTWLQKKLGEGIHLDLYNDFKELGTAIETNNVDMIYANPYDISRLVRDEGFVPVAKPVGKPDEAIIACHAESEIDAIEQLSMPLRIAQTDAPEVNTIGRIMIEPADLDVEAYETIECGSYIVVAKNILNQDADIGFFLAESFDELSALVKKQLKPLMSSKIHMIHHALLVGPKMAHLQGSIRELLLAMHEDDQGRKVLKDLELDRWQILEDEDAEFMIDLIDTLVT